MLPYCYEQLALQQAALEDVGEDEWMARNLREPPAESAPARRLPVAAEAAGF